MPETNDTQAHDTPTKETIDINEALSAIERKISEKLDQSMSSLEAKIPKPKEEPEEPFGFESDDEDAPLTRKEVAELVQKTSSHLQKENEEKMKAISRKNSRDSQAMKEFPELNSESGVFDKKFYDEVGKEIKTRVQSGRNSEDPDLIYDCAAAVANRGIRSGWYTPKEQVQRNQVRKNSREDSFDVSDSMGSRSSGPTEAQVNFAKNMGLSKERLSQILERKR